MTPKQRGMYFAECAKAFAVMRGRGHTGSDDELRRLLTRLALGRVISSTLFNEHEIDLVMAVVWSHSQPDRLDLQLRQIEQPKARLEFLCRHYLLAAGVEKHGLDWYLLAMAKRMKLFGGVAMLSLLDERGWQALLPECNQHRLRAEKRREREAPAKADGAAVAEPF